jgi:acyl-coenzyme A synthetase/AMP-(fatty) acid ligase
VRGRNADMVEVGGKRASLADLTRRLMAVPGVTDAVVFQPDAPGGTGVRRLAALVVAEGLTEPEVLAGLAPAVDPVFLPRPVVFVARLPRNEVGKIPRDQLLAALKR